MKSFIMRIVKAFALSLVFAGHLIGFAQESSMDLPNYHPVSPNAASLGNFGLYPVNKNLGSAGVSIPVYTLSEKKISIPISLNYNMSGIRLNDLASWVGLGWSLNAGGAIVRNTKGLPDLQFYDVIPDLQNYAFNENNWDYLFGATLGLEDTGPDEYVFNALGYSGSFYFDRDNNEAVFDDETQIKITPISKDEIHAILPDGTLLIFGKGSDGTLATEVTNLSTSYAFDYVSAWYLTEVVSIDRQHSISLRYNASGLFQEYSKAVGESVVLDGTFNDQQATANLSTGNYQNTSITRQYFDSILFETGYIKFESSTGRTDLEDDYKLDAIKVYTYDTPSDKLIDEYHFTYDYFFRSGGVFSKDYDHSGSAFNTDRQRNSREYSLKLTGMYRGATASSDAHHEFDYNETTALPLRGSTAQDSWGYPNSNTGTLTPATTTTITAVNQVSYTVGNGDRSPDETKMKAAILEKVTYPTGGHTIFEHEANRFLTTDVVTTSVSSDDTSTTRDYGSECNSNTTPVSTTFNIPATATNIKLNIFMSPVESQGSSQSYVAIDGFEFYRPTPSSQPNSAQDSSDGRTETIDLYFGYDFEFANINATQIFNPGQHTIEAFDTGFGAFGAQNCSFAQIWLTWDEPNGTQQTEQLVGGLRIKSISNYDGISTDPVAVKKFEYEDANLIQPERNRAYVRKFINNAGGSIGLIATVSMSPIFNNNLGGEPVVEYGKVTEYDYDSIAQKDNGKIISYFENIGTTRVVNSVIPAYIFKHPQYSFSYNYNSSNPNFPYWQAVNWQTLFDQALFGVEEFSLFESTSWKRGSLLREETYKRESDDSYTLIKEVDNSYQTLKSRKFYENFVYTPFQQNINDYWNVVDTPSYDQNQDFNSATLCYQIGEVQVGRKSLSQSITKIYDLGGANAVSTTTDYFYENPDHLQVTRTETTNSKGETVITKTYFADDVADTNSLGSPQLTSAEKTTIDRLKKAGLHRISEPIQVETTVNGEKTTQRTSYADWYEDTTTSPSFFLVLPDTIKTLKGTVSSSNPFQDRIIYKDYDDNGDPREVAKAKGPSVSYIWGYNKTYPIAKIEYASYSQIASFEANLQTLSNADVDRTTGSVGTEGALRNALNALRTALPNAMVTTYTYDPMIGVTSITDPRGYVMYYRYDAYNRLEEVRDANNHIITDYDYHYKGQNQ